MWHKVMRKSSSSLSILDVAKPNRDTSPLTTVIESQKLSKNGIWNDGVGGEPNHQIKETKESKAKLKLLVSPVQRRKIKNSRCILPLSRIKSVSR